VSTWSAEVSTWSAEVSTWSATSVWHVDGRTSPAAGASGDRVVETAERYSRGGGVFAPFARPDPRGVIFTRVASARPTDRRLVAPHSGYK
jgi:hypothetical protein